MYNLFPSHLKNTPENSKKVLTRPSLRKNTLAYLLSFILVLSIPNLIFLSQMHFSENPPKPYSANDGVLLAKVEFYKKYREHFNILFIGDSRTHQGIDPEMIDKALGTSSYNMAWLGHWFETQYSQIRDLVPHIYPGTRVVWSIGHQNWGNKDEPRNINRIYPIRWNYVLDYLRNGFSWNQIKENVTTYLFYQPFCEYIPGLHLHSHRLDYYGNFKAWMNKRSDLFPDRINDEKQELRKFKNEDKYRAIKLKHKNDPEVQEVGWKTDGDIITAAVLTKSKGNMFLYELEPSYWRDVQSKKSPLDVLSQEFKGRKELWNLYESILDLFIEHKVHLIVNEIGEAPYCYASDEVFNHYLSALKKAEMIARKKGIPYIRVNYKDLRDDDYFDYNHMNSKGVEKYGNMLIKKLRPYMGIRE